MSTLADLRTLLANLAGEESAPSDASRDLFINQAIKNIYQRRQWSFRKAKESSLAFTAGVATAPSTMAFGDGLGSLRVVNGAIGDGADYIFTVIDESEKDSYNSSYYTCWVSGNETDGFTISTNQSSTFTGELIYYKKPTALSSSSDVCYIPNDLAVCYLALAFLKMYNDPDTDPSPEMAMSNRFVMQMLAQDNRNIPTVMQSPYAASGSYLGQY